jgi:ATP-binding protein involved in chromosome partitioning
MIDASEPSNQPTPVHLEKTDDRCLIIRWDDELEQKISFRKLRESCRCASCNDQREKSSQPQPPSSSLPILSAAEARPLDIVKMHPVGNYAYSIHFSDDHNTGIFTFEMLRSLDWESGA